MYGVAGDLDLSSAGNGLDADGTKLYCTTMAKNVADRAMQVQGATEVLVESTSKRVDFAIMVFPRRFSLRSSAVAIRSHQFVVVGGDGGVGGGGGVGGVVSAQSP